MSEIVGVDYVCINSSLFSAQSRPRHYWTNIKYPKLPTEESHEVIKNIIDETVDDIFYFDKKGLNSFLKKTDGVKPNKDFGIKKLFTVPKEIINDNERQRRVYSINGKSPTILARADTTKIFYRGKIRKLTPIECERLQSLPDNYTDGVSNTQRYKALGNAFNCAVVKHILKNII